MNRCDFSSRTTTLYQNIMDELVTMRQAAIYGYRYYDPETDAAKQEVALDQAVEEFAMKYFMEGTDGLITCRDKELHYLNAGEIASPTSQDPSSTTDTFVE
jgi:soluble cytochrome b562